MEPLFDAKTLPADYAATHRRFALRGCAPL
jgi:hypothetical protein